MSPTHLGRAFLRLVEQNLRHSLDSDGEGYHGVVRHQARPGVHAAGPLCPPLPGVDVTIGCAEGAEHTVARLTEQQLLVGVGGALGDDLPALPRHQVPQLVDEEGGREGLDPARGDRDQLPTHWAPGGEILSCYKY